MGKLVGFRVSPRGPGQVAMPSLSDFIKTLMQLKVLV